MFLLGEKIEGESCMSAEGSSVKGSSQQSSTSFPWFKGGGPVIFRPGPIYYRGFVNDTTRVSCSVNEPLGSFSTEPKQFFITNQQRYVKVKFSVVSVCLTILSVPRI